jgi:type I restriction enzyme S subunit
MSEETSLDDFNAEIDQSSSLELGPIEIDIPKVWDSEKLHEVLELTTGNNYTGDHLSDLDNGGRIFLTLKSINKGGGFNWDSVKYYSGEVNNREIVEPGELLIANTDLTQDGAIVGYSARVPDFDSDKEIAASMDLSILRPKSDDVNLPYIEYLLQTDYIHSRMRAFSAGSTVLHLNTDLVETLSLPLPTLEEQRKIATVLYTVDQVIQKTNEILTQLETVQLGLVRTLFGKGGTQRSSERETKTERLGPKRFQVPTTWEVTDIASIGKVVTGDTPSTENDENFGGSLPFVTPETLSQGKCVTESARTLSESGRNEAKPIPMDSVMMDCIGSDMGKVAVAGREMATNQQINSVVVEDSEYLPEFLYYHLRVLSDFIKSQAGQTATPIVNKSSFESFAIFKPPVQEQQDIVDTLSVYDEGMRINEEYLFELGRAKQGLMQDLLSGAVRTHEVDIDIPDEVLAQG